jgi:hypothetical protein
MGGWVGPKTDVAALDKRKIYCPQWDLNPRLPALSLLTLRYSYINLLKPSSNFTFNQV